MADPEHLSILKKCVDTWNAWRREHPDIRPDLSNAYLTGASLSRVDFSNTRLNNARLNGADFSRSNLSRGSLKGAYLSKANLAGADVTDTDLRGANLEYTDLSDADLGQANLSANLTGANLSRANLTRANLKAAASINLRQIASARTLHGAILPPAVLDQVRKYYPHLLEEPEPRVAMAIRSDIRGDVAVVSVTGSVEADDLPRLHDQITEVLHAGLRNLVADLTGIPYVGGPAIGVMASVLVSLRQEGGDLRIVALQPVRGVLELVRAFLLFETVDEAVQSYENRAPDAPE